MRIGTRSLLFGVHQIFIHPCWLFVAWWRLYGFPTDPRLWVCFFVHDLGYYGRPEMDGALGDLHPEGGAAIAGRLFDRAGSTSWYKFCLYHSRFLAQANGENFSRLCVADKLAVVLEPWWFYLPRAWLTGELSEYMASAAPGEKHAHTELHSDSSIEWYRSTQSYLRCWVEEHRASATHEPTVH